MRNTLISVSVLAIGTFFILTENLNHLYSSTQPESSYSDSRGSLEVMKIQQAHLRTIDPFDIDIMPTSRPVTVRHPLGSGFGMRKHPILGIDRMHKGIDFGAPFGTPVLASATGRVSEAVILSDSSSYGRYIVIEHDEEYSSLYAHLSRLKVKRGEIVEEGDTIGFVGSTGLSTNPHLHYEVIYDGERVDPEDFF